MGHPGDIRTLKMAWQGRTWLSRVLRKVRVDFRQKMGERNRGQGLRNTLVNHHRELPEVFRFLTLRVCSLFPEEPAQRKYSNLGPSHLLS